MSDYPTCHTTFARFRVIDDYACITTDILGIPSEIPFTDKGIWVGLSSKEAVDSQDSEKHILWILNQLKSKRAQLAQIIAAGCSVDISVFWKSAHGHGGPMVSPKTSELLGDMGIMLWFDFYA